MGPYYLYTRLPSRCYMLLARPDPKVSLVSQSREWKINMAGVETSEKITAAKNLCLKRTVRPKYGSILAKRKTTFHKFRYCASRTVKLWSRREEIQLISTVIWNTTTGSYMKISENVMPNLPKLLTKSQVTIRETTIDQSFTNATPYGKT